MHHGVGSTRLPQLAHYWAVAVPIQLQAVLPLALASKEHHVSDVDLRKCKSIGWIRVNCRKKARSKEPDRPYRNTMFTRKIWSQNGSINPFFSEQHPLILGRTKNLRYFPKKPCQMFCSDVILRTIQVQIYYVFLRFSAVARLPAVVEGLHVVECWLTSGWLTSVSRIVSNRRHSVTKDLRQ